MLVVSQAWQKNAIKCGMFLTTLDKDFPLFYKFSKEENNRTVLKATQTYKPRLCGARRQKKAELHGVGKINIGLMQKNQVKLVVVFEGGPHRQILKIPVSHLGNSGEQFIEFRWCNYSE
ncbi:hypothetical protein RUM43_006940 [Polyplax serrata]|uniref:Uncharacterized protein n=1 Tax=Polyplax serrata TaxID=468196 RepID=A0AAN8S0W5_POLSC